MAMIFTNGKASLPKINTFATFYKKLHHKKS